VSEEEREMLKRNKAINPFEAFRFLAQGVEIFEILAKSLEIKPELAGRLVCEGNVKIKHLNAIRRKHVKKDQWGTFKRVLREIKKAK
jgi:hypothetical protein